MHQTHNIGLAFKEISQTHAHFPAILSPTDTVTFGELWRLTITLAKRFRAAGVNRSSILALSTGDIRVSLATLFATALLGCRFVVAGPVLAKSKAVRPTHFYCTTEVTTPRKARFEFIGEETFAAASEAKIEEKCEFPGYSDPNAPWMYLHTSGTTGTAKFIALSQSTVFHRTAAIESDFPYASTTMAPLFGVTTRPFYARAIGALLNACAIVNSHDIKYWHEIGVNYVCASPGQVTNHFAATSDPQRKLKRVEVSGAKLSGEQISALLTHFDEVIDVYGASETNKTYANASTYQDDGVIACQGRMLDSEIEIRDEDGVLCPIGVIGQVRVRNPYLVESYIGRPEETKNAFVDGWFVPGDYAMWAENDVLEIVGRKDDVVSIGGRKINAHLVDLVIKLVPGVADAISFRNPKPGAGNELVAFVQFGKLVSRGSCYAAIHAKLQDMLGLGIPVRNLYSISQVPRDEDGQPMRSVCELILLERVAELDDGDQFE